jgi:hypothetical protein
MVRAAVEAASVEVVAELGGDDDVLAERGQRLADQLLIGERAINFGGVEEGDAAGHSRADQRDHGVAIRRRTAVMIEPHAAESDGRDIEAAFPKLAGVHSVLLATVEGQMPDSSNTLRAIRSAVIAGG